MMLLKRFTLQICVAIVLLVCCGVSACGGDNDPVQLFKRGDYSAAFKIFRERADSGDLVACNYLGTHYYLGVGVERDFAQAVKWFQVAALAAQPEAQRNLGVMYLRGLGIKKDYHLAYGWMYYAHRGGNRGAKEYLNLMSDNVTPNASIVARRTVRQKLERHAAAALN